MIIFLAGLLDVPRQLYEAADIEGASGWQKFRRVTLPDDHAGDLLLARDRRDPGVPVLHAGLRGEHHPRAGSGRAWARPQNSLLFYAIYLYQQGFNYFRMGYASAMAWVLFVVTMVCTIALIKTSKRWVHYQGGMFK